MSFAGWTKVFRFTFSQQTHRKGYRTATVLGTLLLLVLIAAIISLTHTGSGGSAEIRQVVVCGEEPAGFDWNGFDPDVDFSHADSLDEALSQAKTLGKYAVVLEISEDEELLQVRAVRPDGGNVDEDTCFMLADGAGFAMNCFRRGLTPEQTEAVSRYASYSVEPTALSELGTDEDTLEGVRMVLPYCTVLILYFLILFYGQGVANSAILEKTSKLMDTFLLSVKPAGMMLGKLLGITVAGLLQLFCWIAGITAGFAGGFALAHLWDPNGAYPVLQLLETARSAGAMFSPAAIVLTVGIIIGGFFVYCSLSAIGGAMAAKPEELSTTNTLFSLVLVISFLLTLNKSVLQGGSSVILTYVPFTSAFITPGSLLLGDITPVQGLISLAIMAATILLLSFVAGKAYTMFSFWKGNPPTPKKLIAMLRKKG